MKRKVGRPRKSKNVVDTFLDTFLKQTPSKIQVSMTLPMFLKFLDFIKQKV